jgi:membrane-associated protease RseP (regulator of RpoE activity)
LIFESDPEYWLLVVAGVILYLLATSFGDRSELLKRHNITMWGPLSFLTPVIFWRTKRGIKLLEVLGGPRAFWRVVATVGIPLVIIGMLYFLSILMLMNYVMIQSPPEPSSYNAPRNILLIPGVNQFVPFVWGWIALFVTMVVHEFAHGILCRAEGIKVKSMGLVFLIFPIAAFVEPDEEELFGTASRPAVASRGARVRILSAGVISNFLVAGVAIALFLGPVLGGIAPLDRVVVADVEKGSLGESLGIHSSMILEGTEGEALDNLGELYDSMLKGTPLILKDSDTQRTVRFGEGAMRGIMVASIFDGGPAYQAGMPDRFVISALNGQPIKDLQDFRAFMNTTKPEELLSITTSKGVYEVALDAKEDGLGYIGIAISGNAVYSDGVTFQEFPASPFLNVLKRIPTGGLVGFTTFMGLPFAGIPGFTENGFQGFSGWIESFFMAKGWAEPLGSKVFWLADLLLWVGWINLYAGLFNCLPAVPLDGGHIFRDLVACVLEKAFGRGERVEKMTRTVVAFLAWLVFSSVLFTVLGPYLAHGIPS